MKMLIGAGAAAEPRIVGHVEKPARPRTAVGYLVGKDDLVADERPRRRSAGDREQARAGAGAEASAHAGELEDAETLHEVLERQILAERHEMDLVVAVEHLALVADREQAVIDAR